MNISDKKKSKVRCRGRSSPARMVSGIMAFAMIFCSTGIDSYAGLGDMTQGPAGMYHAETEQKIAKRTGQVDKKQDDLITAPDEETGNEITITPPNEGRQGTMIPVEWTDWSPQIIPGTEGTGSVLWADI